MSIIFAILESSVLFMSVCGMMLVTSGLFASDWTSVMTHLGQASVLTLCCLVSFYSNHFYNLRRVKSFGEFSRRLGPALRLLVILLTACYVALPWMRTAADPFFPMLWGLLMSVTLVLVFRGTLYAMLKSRLFTERVLILGTGPLAQDIAREIVATPHLRYTIVGYVRDVSAASSNLTPHPPCPILGSLELLEKIIEEYRPARIIVALTERRLRLPVWVLLNSSVNGILIEDGIEVYERFTKKLAIESLKPSFLIFSKDFKQSKLHMSLRRMVSLTIAAAGLLLTGPFLGLIALAIKLDSKGSVFFAQDRIGLGGRPFRLLKFRTMHPPAVVGTEPVWSRDVVSRITRVGKWLRMLHIDELPQFINILRGDMDLVGPRPEMASNVKTMSEQIPYYVLRNTIRPGLTGWAQVNNGYAMSQEEVTEKMRYDLYYIKHKSLWFDLRILAATVKLVLFGHGKP